MGPNVFHGLVTILTWPDINSSQSLRTDWRLGVLSTMLFLMDIHVAFMSSWAEIWRGNDTISMVPFHDRTQARATRVSWTSPFRQLTAPQPPESHRTPSSDRGSSGSPSPQSTRSRLRPMPTGRRSRGPSRRSNH